MFERKEIITDQVNALFDAAVALGRGGLLPHRKIEEVTGHARNSGRWKHVVDRLRRRLRDEAEIVIRPEVGVGYRLLLKGEQLGCLAGRMQKARRQVRTGGKEVGAMSPAGLSLHDQVVRARAVAEADDQQRALRRAIEDQKAAIRPTPVNPRYRPPEAV